MNQQDPIDTLARTCWGEARNQDLFGMECVANVVMNRVAQPAWWGDDVCSVCLHPYQFSCWNEGDPNRVKVESVDGSDAQFMVALAIAQHAVNNQLTDNTNGATMYKVIGTDADWAKGQTPCAVYKAHEFYNLKP